MYSPEAASADLLFAPTPRPARPAAFHKSAYRALVARMHKAEEPRKIRIESVEAAIDRVRYETTVFPHVPLV